MHVVIWFVILTSLVAGFNREHVPPEEHTYIVMDQGDRQMKINEYMVSSQALTQKHIVTQEFDYSCGAASLATLLNYHLGEQFSEMQVIRGLMNYGNLQRIQERRAFSLLDMKRFVDALGYEGTGYKAEMYNLKELDVPVVLPIDIFGYQHFVVFRGIADNRVFLADPWLGHTTYTIEAFEAMWYRQVIFMVDAKGRPQRNMLRLTVDDMRFIDEDLVRWTLFDRDPLHMEVPFVREYRLLDPNVNVYKRK